MNKRRFLKGTLLMLGLCALTAAAAPLQAHEGDCPLCSLPVVQDTPEQANEVALRYGRKRIEYRCVYCALKEAHTEYSGDLSILAPSEDKSAPVVLKRTNKKWSADPQNAIFVAQKANHKVCQITYRAFATRVAFDAYAKKHGDLFDKDIKPLTLSQMLDITKPKSQSTEEK
ncbi:MAG TPA: hypothetical protein VF600_09410 [Abditibacteriaceae bacterium]|jgi:hypothetical protein